MLQRVAMCCSVLQCMAVRYGVFRRVAVTQLAITTGPKVRGLGALAAADNLKPLT